MWQICPSVPELPPSGGNPIRTHTHQVIEMSSANSFNGPQKLSPSEVTRILSGMSPLQATRYYNKCMTNPNTPVENVNLLMQFRAQNPNKFLSEDQIKGSRRSKGSWMAGKGYSGGWKDKSNGRVYSQGYSYDAYGRAYDPSGNYVRYIQDNQVFTLAHNFDLAYSAYLRYKDDLMKEHLSLSDFVSIVPFAMSTLEIFPQNKDLVMSGPFDEPDEYFLRRQKAAFGELSIDV